jgi:hypothetical protein
MNQSDIGPRYLMRWDHSRDQRLLDDLVSTTHRLAELPTFSDEGLAEIVDRYPREAIQVSTMGKNPAYPNQLRTGLLGQHNGDALIEMVRRGRLCIRLCNVVTNSQTLSRLVQRLCAEMIECQPGLRTEDHDGELEISSPHALTYYRFDVQPNVFWQIRGSRKVFVYPGREPFISSRTLTQVIACGFDRPLYFEPAFDDHVQVLEQNSGELVGLTHLSPYRIVNDNSLNVVLTTRYSTRATRRRLNIHRVNHQLSRFLPIATSNATSTRQDGAWSAIKSGLVNLLPARFVTEWQPEPSFLVDPNQPHCVAPLWTEPQQVPDDFTGLPTLNVPGFQFDANYNAISAMENR